jgi:hypothetical protein
MGHWVMKFEVEGDLGVETGVPVLLFTHPSGAYQIHLENHNMQPGCDIPLLNAYIVFDEGDLSPGLGTPETNRDTYESASNAAEKYLTRFLYFLNFATGYRFRLKRRLCLFDWTPAVAQRHGIVYRDFPDPNLPLLALNQELLSSIEQLVEADLDDDLMQSLRWFAAGVSLKSPDLQFQMFWLSIETLADYTKDPARVPEPCPQCSKPLYCANCQRTPTHRPYSKQAVQQLFSRHVSDEPKLVYELAYTMRNALLHGGQISHVEQNSGRTLVQLVDVVAKVSWAALFSALTQRAGLGEEVLYLFQPTTFLHFGVQGTLHTSFPSPLGRDPEFSDLPDTNLELLVEEFTEEPQESAPDEVI